MNRHNYQEKKIIGLEVAFYFGRWEKMVGCRGETLSRWRLHTGNTQKCSRLPVCSESVEDQEVPKAKSSSLAVWTFTASPFSGLWIRSQRNHSRARQGGKWIFPPWMWANAAFVTPVSSYQLYWLHLCPLWGFLISCWASNRHVNPECNCEVTKGEARVTKGKRRTEGKESIHKICICSVTRARSLQGHTAERHLCQADVSVDLCAGPRIGMITGKCWQAQQVRLPCWF